MMSAFLIIDDDEFLLLLIRAVNEARTRDPQLGKLIRFVLLLITYLITKIKKRLPLEVLKNVKWGLGLNIGKIRICCQPSLTTF